MAEYILQILRTQLMVVFSWGFNSPRKLPDDKGLSFIVNGFKYQGKVTVIYDKSTDLFNVTLENGEREEGVYLDCLVNAIDSMVERCDNYKQTVECYYHLNN
jgi:sRNA-binding regulator protein Hfq